MLADKKKSGGKTAEELVRHIQTFLRCASGRFSLFSQKKKNAHQSDAFKHSEQSSGSLRLVADLTPLVHS